MVIGLDKFREYFKEFTGSYTIIGGTACDVILTDAGFTPRATKDIDMILNVEALSPEFVKQFWVFIEKADYERKEKSIDKRKYYRFMNPGNKEFPKQIELFSRNPDLNLEEDTYLTPIPVNDDISSLSAILLNDEYYHYTIKHSMVEDDINIANTEALICLKARAALDMAKRNLHGKKVDSKNIRKHKTDVFRMAVMLSPDDVFTLPESIKIDMKKFVDLIRNGLPDKKIFKDLGIPNIDLEELFKQFLNNFKLGVE